MKDFLGNVLSIGDIVAVAPKNYRGLVRARVVKFTPQKVLLSYRAASWDTEDTTYLIEPDAVVLVSAAK